MGIKAVLFSIKKRPLHTETLQLPSEFSDDGVHLITGSPFLAHGIFKASVLVGAVTTILAQPKAGGSLIITDVVISAKKVVGTTIDLRFSDGVDTETMISPDTVNQSTNLTWTPKGRIQGWKDACVEVVTTGSVLGTITVGYVKVNTSLSFSDWNDLR